MLAFNDQLQTVAQANVRRPQIFMELRTEVRAGDPVFTCLISSRGFADANAIFDVDQAAVATSAQTSQGTNFGAEAVGSARLLRVEVARVGVPPPAVVDVFDSFTPRSDNQTEIGDFQWSDNLTLDDAGLTCANECIFSLLSDVPTNNREVSLTALAQGTVSLDFHTVTASLTGTKNRVTAYSATCASTVRRSPGPSACS